MATWEDGPEYAPVERPAAYAPPAAPALDVVSAGAGESSSGPSLVAPPPRPAFDVPPASVVALAQLAPAEPDRRDPGVPFDVVSSTLTSMDSAWGAAHWSAPGGAAAMTPAVPLLTAPGAGSTLPPVQPWPPPPDTSWPPPPMLPAGSAPAPYPGGFPPPGTPQWFGPGPPQVQQSPAVVETDTRAVVEAATPALCICLAIGGFLYPLAPLMLGLALLASSRVRVARPQVRRAFLVAGITLAVLAVIGLLLPSTYTAGDWWSFLGAWSLAICWVLLVTVVVLVHRGLQRLVPPPPPRYPPYR